MNDHQPLLTMVNPCEPIHHPDPPGPLNGQAALLQQAICGAVLNLLPESGGKWGGKVVETCWNQNEILILVQFPRVPNFSELARSSESHFARMPGLVASVPVFARKIPRDVFVGAFWFWKPNGAWFSPMACCNSMQFSSLRVFDFGDLAVSISRKVTKYLRCYISPPKTIPNPKTASSGSSSMDTTGPPGGPALMDSLEQKKTIMMGVLFAAIMGRYMGILGYLLSVACLKMMGKA